MKLFISIRVEGIIMEYKFGRGGLEGVRVGLVERWVGDVYFYFRRGFIYGIMFLSFVIL